MTAAEQAFEAWWIKTHPVINNADDCLQIWLAAWTQAVAQTRAQDARIAQQHEAHCPNGQECGIAISIAIEASAIRGQEGR